MTRLRQSLNALRYAYLAGFSDYTTIFTWRSWLAGWYVRVLAQVSFFALIGRLVGSEGQAHFLLVGNAILLAAAGTLFSISSTSWERYAGTLPLLVASPTGSVLVFLGRSTFWIPDALASSLGTFFVAGAIFGLPLPWPRVLLVVPLAALVAVSTYMFGIFLGGIVVRNPNLRNLVANVTWMTIAAIGGVNVPRSYEPGAVRVLADGLPLVHGLRAVRGVLEGAPASAVVQQVLAECGVGLAYLALAYLTFDRFAERGRRDGSIEFAA